MKGWRIYSIGEYSIKHDSDGFYVDPFGKDSYNCGFNTIEEALIAAMIISKGDFDINTLYTTVEITCRTMGMKKDNENE